MLAGPIGSGKTSVGEILRDLGAEVIEADAIGHEVLQPGEVAHPAVAARWPEVVSGDGTIDRARLASIVFSDRRALAVLEALTHPHIAARIERRAATARARLVVVELPLVVDILGEGWPRLVVLADAQTRVARAVARGMDEADVRRRMAAQATEDEWRRSATWVLENDGSPAELATRVADWWAGLVGEH